MALSKARLVLEDGSSYEGFSFGAEKGISGEVVFNTSMVGYPESLTDPSYKGQILTLTYPLIGNYGVPDNKPISGIIKNFESEKIQVSGLIIADYCQSYSHWSGVKSLAQWLKESDIPALYGIDTRALTKRLREKGTMLGKIVFSKDIKFADPNKSNLVKEVSIKEPVTYGNGEKTIALIDCGVKANIIRSLLKRGLRIVRVPWDYNFFHEQFDGILVSNGPGNPKMVTATIRNIKRAIGEELPTMGICLGNQLLALAVGANTYKLKYGHRSQNQPCIEDKTNRCFITAQNHGFAVDAETLPKDWKTWFFNANDGTNEGIRHRSAPFMGVQFHPEATPGPLDTDFLFDYFLKLIKNG